MMDRVMYRPMASSTVLVAVVVAAVVVGCVALEWMLSRLYCLLLLLSLLRLWVFEDVGHMVLIDTVNCYYCWTVSLQMMILVVVVMENHLNYW